jgi:hypothetical protein
MGRRLVILAAIFALAAGSAARSQEVVPIGPGELGLAVLERPAQPRGSVILVSGGDGVLGIQPDGTITRSQGNQLVRTRSEYAGQGLATLTVDRGVDLGAAVRYMRRIARPVAIVATSRGTLRTARSLLGASGASRPDTVVFTSGYYLPGAGPSTVQDILKSPSRLPPTLVVHNRNDACRETPPEGVPAIQAWGGQRVQVVWIDTNSGGGHPCGPFSPHGFQDADGRVVGTVASHVVSVR